MATPNDIDHALRQLNGAVIGLIRHAKETLASIPTARDGWPTTASGSDATRVSGGELTSSVEAAVLARQARTDTGQPVGAAVLLDEIFAELTEARGLIKGAARRMGTLGRLTPPPDNSDARCIGDTGENHSHLWVRPDCTNIAEPRTDSSFLGLCCSCRKRRSATVRALPG